jgi:hypothetical protein
MKSKDENRGASQANTRFAETSLATCLPIAQPNLDSSVQKRWPIQAFFWLERGTFPGSRECFSRSRSGVLQPPPARDISPTRRKYLRLIFSFHSPTIVPMRALPFPKCCVVCCKKCGHDVEAGTNGFPATSIFVVCSLCGERRRYLPSEVIHGRPHSVARKRRAISAPGKVAPFCPPGQIAARRPESASLPHWYRAKSNRRSA